MSEDQELRDITYRLGAEAGLLFREPMFAETMREAKTEIERLRAENAQLSAALRSIVDGYYSDDESLPTSEQWDDARVAIRERSTP